MRIIIGRDWSSRSINSLERAMRAKQVLVVLALMVGTVPAFAAGWTPAVSITSAFTEDSDAIFVYAADPAVYTAGCYPGAWVFSTASETRRARAWATALAAIAAGYKVSFWYTDSCAVYGFHSFSAIRIVAP
jgi:nucleotide-binding universal stress UspA family protein